MLPLLCCRISKRPGSIPSCLKNSFARFSFDTKRNEFETETFPIFSGHTKRWDATGSRNRKKRKVLRKKISTRCSGFFFSSKLTNSSHAACFFLRYKKETPFVNKTGYNWFPKAGTLATCCNPSRGMLLFRWI